MRAEKKPGLQIRSQGGSVLSAGSVKAVPYQRAVLYRGKNFGWVWNRPSHLLVETEGRIDRIPIPDLTRRFQALFLGAGLIFLLAGWIYSGKRKENSR